MHDDFTDNCRRGLRECLTTSDDIGISHFKVELGEIETRDDVSDDDKKVWITK